MHGVNVTDARSMIAAFGLAGIMAILFVESGLLVGFFLPGDSLLFLAGVGASGAATEVFGHAGFRLPLAWLLLCAPVSAIAGAQLGHLLGARLGPKLFAHRRSRLFKREYVDRAEAYLSHYGAGKAIVLARFVPILRTFLNPVTGVLGVRARVFFVWNVLGGTLWTVGITMLGYALGDSFQGGIDDYLMPAVVLIMVASLLPMLIKAIRSRGRPAVSGGKRAANRDHGRGRRHERGQDQQTERQVDRPGDQWPADLPETDHDQDLAQRLIGGAPTAGDA